MRLLVTDGTDEGSNTRPSARQAGPERTLADRFTAPRPDQA